MKVISKTIIAMGAIALVSNAVMAAGAGGSYVLKRIQDRGTINMGHREASVPFAYIKDGSSIG